MIIATGNEIASAVRALLRVRKYSGLEWNKKVKLDSKQEHRDSDRGAVRRQLKQFHVPSPA